MFHVWQNPDFRFGDLELQRHKSGAYGYRIFFVFMHSYICGMCGETFGSAGFRCSQFANLAHSAFCFWRNDKRISINYYTTEIRHAREHHRCVRTHPLHNSLRSSHIKPFHPKKRLLHKVQSLCRFCCWSHVPSPTRQLNKNFTKPIQHHHGYYFHGAHQICSRWVFTHR